MVLSIPGLSPDMVAFLTTFLFTFAVVFGLLSYSKMFVSRNKEGEPTGKEPRGVWALIALVAAVATASYEPAAAAFQQLIPPAAIFLTAVFFLVFLKQVIFGRGKAGEGKKNPWIPIILLAIAIILLAAFSSEIALMFGGASQLSGDTVLYAAGIAVILGILYLVGREAS